MNKEYPTRFACIGLLLCVIILLTQGCATQPKIPSYKYLQRTPVRVAVLPSINNTEKPDASIVFNKACEETLRKNGFEVISADQVVTYASANGVLLHDVTSSKASEIGNDLDADMVLYSEINTWETKYIVLNTTSIVSGVSRLTETSTDSVLWRYDWTFQQKSSGSNNGLIGMLVEAAVTAVVNSAFDECSRLGQQAAIVTVNSMPQPGIAPVTEKSM